MGDQTTDRADRRRDAAPAESAPGEPRGLRDRILGEAPTVFVTLVSVLVGLVLTDLVTEARAREICDRLKAANQGCLVVRK